MHGISTPPKQSVSGAEMEAAAGDFTVAEALFDRLREASGAHTCLALHQPASVDGFAPGMAALCHCRQARGGLFAS